MLQSIPVMLQTTRTTVTMLGAYLFLYSYLGGSAVSAMFDQSKCEYTFNVWHPDENVLQQMRDLHMQFSNFTNYAELQVSRIQRNVVHEMREYDNSTKYLESEVSQLRMQNMQSKLKHSHLVAEVNVIRRDLVETTRKIDDMEMDYFSLKSRVREPRNETPRKGHRSLNRDFIGLMKNSVGDLKAEWLLMKREIDDMKSENVQLKHGQNELKNESTNLRQVIRSLSGDIQAVDWRVPHNPQQFQGEVALLKRDVRRIKDEQSDLKSTTNQLQEDVASLHTSHIKTQKELHEMELESTRVREKLESLRLQESNGKVMNYLPRETPEPKVHTTEDFTARDCHEIYQAGSRISGLYNIKPLGASMMVSAYCEMVNKTGYTMLQRRIDGLLNFNRRWMEYKHGFGNPYAEFYLGNQLIHLMSKQKSYILRVDIWDWEGNKAYAEYNAFAIEDEINHYRIHISGYQGDAGDSLGYHDNMAFSTEDVDNDLHTRHCAAENKGGWWFNSCYSSNLNGVFHTAWYSQARTTFADGVVWYTWKKSEFYSLRKSEMKMRPKVP